MRYLLSLLLILPAWTVERTVCASGCDHTTLQAAWDAASNDDIITLTAGETFASVHLKTPLTGVTIRTSAYASLPAQGVRIHAINDAALLAKVQSSDADAALGFGYTENVVVDNGVNTGTDVITFENVDGFANDVKVNCFAGQDGDNDPSDDMPAPLTRGTAYWIRDYNGGAKTLKLAATQGGAAIDLTTVGNASYTGSTSPNYYRRPRCIKWDNPSDITVQGIEMVNNSDGSGAWVTFVGLMANGNLDSGPNNITFEHVVIRGESNQFLGPLNGLIFGGGTGHVIRDSWIDWIKCGNGCESHGIVMSNTGTITIQNNYINAASINVITGGGDSSTLSVVSNVTMTQNFLEKRSEWFFKSGAGAPSGSCYYGGHSAPAGSRYLNTTGSPTDCLSGNCYRCDSNNTWVQDTSLPFRSSGNNKGPQHSKNMTEFKECDNCTISSNLFRASWVGGDQGGGCFALVVGKGTGFGSPYHIGHDVTFQNNQCDHTFGGVTIASTSVSESDPFDQIPVRDVTIDNLLITNIGWFPALSSRSSASDAWPRPITISGGIENLTIKNVTARAKDTEGVTRDAILFFGGDWTTEEMPGLDIRNNLLSSNNAGGAGIVGGFPPLSTADCHATTGLGIFTPDGTSIRHNAIFGRNGSNDYIDGSGCQEASGGPNLNVSFTVDPADVDFNADSSLQSTSPYSAANGSATLIGTDGDDLGAKITTLAPLMANAESGNWVSSFKTKINGGSTVGRGVTIR